ncbi:MAG: hypothetical protein AVO35_08680 [Candidatus Aegiribacteria sp. MLS_C]|nr:MAG: hypothetical protein AVO35_08680 [Candidatus Aegiribacteria sp. MLS_C]
MPLLSVVIPSRDGLSILRSYLPAVLRETEAAGGEVIVVDDCSSDGTTDSLFRDFPSVRTFTRTGGPGFPMAVNEGMRMAEGDFLLLLNNDTVPEEGSFEALLRELGSSPADVAAAVPSIPRPDGTDDGAFQWAFRRGLAVTGQDIGGEPYPSGACSLWRREAWEALGGLNGSYAPIYWEDADMGARMTRSGYQMIRCPEISVAHHHASTMGSGAGTSILRERNRFIFMDLNCTDRAMLSARGRWLPAHLTKAILTGNRAFVRGYLAYRSLRRLET